LDVTNAPCRPHDAALAAKCLFLLQELHRRPATSGDAARASVAAGVPAAQQPAPHADDCWLCHGHADTLLPYLVRARSYGSRHHRLLESESARLIRRLEQQRDAGSQSPPPEQQRTPQELATAT
jgi:hypothetical protein